MHFNDDAGDDGFGAFEFSSKNEVSDPVADTEIADRLLPGSFIITTKFKRTSTKSAYLFAISDERRLQLGLKLTAAAAYVTRAILSCDCLAARTVSLDYFTPNAWTEMAIAVTDDHVFLYIDCIKVGNVTLQDPPSEFKISKSSTMHIAHYMDNGNEVHFEPHKIKLTECLFDFDTENLLSDLRMGLLSSNATHLSLTVGSSA
ncbi:hypothetical protein EVAR_50509_1 [Eumeta japonica]|uniref:Laminin G domain-containing protein n=1 Tax=Eumeta variegata TaxID=151549 RepID=A0A4C1X7J1_EUMVA|nr:hypothetical protein EVAR_50509_1 [Eumeta japonica]